MTLIDAGALVDDFDMSGDLGPLQVYRPGSRVLNGFREYVQGDDTLYSVTPWVAHPADGESLVLVPEAYRSTDITEFYANNFVYRLFDRIVYDGFSWQVVRMDNYMTQGGACFALASKMP